MLRCLNCSALIRVILEAMPVHPTLAKPVATFVQIVPLVASAGAPNRILFPAMALRIRESSWKEQVHVRSVQAPTTREYFEGHSLNALPADLAYSANNTSGVKRCPSHVALCAVGVALRLPQHLDTR